MEFDDFRGDFTQIDLAKNDITKDYKKDLIQEFLVQINQILQNAKMQNIEHCSKSDGIAANISKMENIEIEEIESGTIEENLQILDNLSNSHFLVIDRFEGNIAVCEDRTTR